MPAEKFLLAFIPVFVAVDAIGVLPIFIVLTQGLGWREKLRVITESVLTAIAVALGFVFVGQAVFRFLGITIGDFMVAGGAILFCIAVIDLVSPGKKRRAPQGESGAVPLGTPLIVGPAVLTTSLIVIGEYGLMVTIFSLLVNIMIAGLVFSLSQVFIRILGVSGAKVLSKITSLLLGAIAVMLIRKGIFYFLSL